MEFLSTKQVSELLNIPVRTVRYLAGSRVLPGATKIGKLWRFRKDLLLGWLAKQAEPAPEEAVLVAPTPAKVARTG